MQKNPLQTKLFAKFCNLANIMLCQAQKGEVDRKFHHTHPTSEFALNCKGQLFC